MVQQDIHAFQRLVLWSLVQNLTTSQHQAHSLVLLVIYGCDLKCTACNEHTSCIAVFALVSSLIDTSMSSSGRVSLAKHAVAYL